MAKTYRSFEPDQLFLMPPSLTDWLASNHLVYFVRDILREIDLSPITSVYEKEERGYPPYHPIAMTGILLYGYCNGITSSRKLEKRCQEDIAFRVLAANNQPDHRTISDFRKLHLAALEHLFAEVLQLCQKAGLVKFGHISLDGTKVKANASKHKAMSYGRMKKDITRLQQEIKALLQEAEETDEREDRLYGKDKRGDELPEELARRESRLARIKEAKRALEQEAKKQAKDHDKPKPLPDEQMPMAKVKTERDAHSGKERVAADAQRNFTDPDSRIMPYQKTFVQAYNAQVAVDREHQIIVATDLSNNPTDDPLLPWMVSRLPKKPKAFSADAGYSVKENNLTYLKKKRIDAYIAIKGMKHDRSLRHTRSPRGPIPRDLTIKERMTRKLLTIKGRRLYAKRKCIAEPPIGQIKQVQGFRQFSLRTYAKARAEWFLVTATHNLRKLFKACCEQPKRRSLVFAQ
jgi:transposase/signal recognition particle subunit SEC65